MRNLLTVILSFVLLGLIACNKKPKVGKLENNKQKVSYTIGQQIGRNLKAQGVEIDVNTLAASITEALEGKESKLKPDEMQAAMAAMQEELVEKRKKDGEENLKKGEEFLAANKSKEGVKTTESGLQYKVVKEGSGESPKAEDVVEVHYVGRLIDGTEFDSSIKRDQTAKFPVNNVIPGWTEGLQLMKEGAKYEFFIPAKLAYGERGRPSIPPNSVLVFEVELVKVNPEEPKKESDKKEG